MGKSNDEALARLEHKVDFLLMYFVRLMGPNWLQKMGDGSHVCPVCKQHVKYIIDTLDQSVTRQCGCKTGKFAPLNLEQFAPPRAAGGKKDGESAGDGDAASDGDSGTGGRIRPQGSRRR